MGAGRAGRLPLSPDPSSASSVNSGGSVRKAIELTSGGLHRVPCGSLDPNWTARTERCANAVQKSAEGIVAIRRRSRRKRVAVAVKARTE
jgi:hypothetical protein